MPAARSASSCVYCSSATSFILGWSVYAICSKDAPLLMEFRLLMSGERMSVDEMTTKKLNKANASDEQTCRIHNRTGPSPEGPA